MNNTYGNKLFEDLSQIWQDVEHLTKLDAQSLFNAFVNDCVNPDFASKFQKDFNSRRRIGVRFFHHCEEVGFDQTIQAHLKAHPASGLIVSALWNGYDDPIAFKLRGHVANVDQVFVDGHDAIAKLSYEGKNTYLFMDGHMESVAVIKMPAGKGKEAK